MIRKQVEQDIENIIRELGEGPGLVLVERSTTPDYGEYSTNIVLRLGKPELALKLAERISELDNYSAEVVNGFINITLAPDVWLEELKKILELRENYAHLRKGMERTVNVEFISANPTGQLHMGNGRGAFFGDVLSNVLEKAGFNVQREYYVNDAKVSLQIKELGKTALGKGESYLTDYLKKIIKELGPELKGVKDESEAGYIVAQKVLRDIRDLVELKMGVRIDKWFFENDLYESKEIEVASSRIPMYQKDGAIWARTTEFGDDEDRVIIRSDGTPGYFLSDIAYHLNKASRADFIIDIWGADHQGHVKRMYAAAEALGFKEKLQILITQIVHLKEGGESKKMSKRRGEIVPLDWLIEKVGLDAARFFYLSKSLNTHMDFDIVLAKEQSQKNPVYYVQYSYARSHQIFAKAKADGKTPGVKEEADLSLLKEPNELALIKKLAEYPELVEDIINSYEKNQSYDIHKLTTYAMELSAQFHKFYENIRVLMDEEGLQSARLALVRAYQIILKDCLELLGISAPEKM